MLRSVLVPGQNITLSILAAPLPFLCSMVCPWFCGHQISCLLGFLICMCVGLQLMLRLLILRAWGTTWSLRVTIVGPAELSPLLLSLGW